MDTKSPSPKSPEMASVTIPVVADSAHTNESFIESDEIESVLAEAKQLIQMKPISSLSGKLVMVEWPFFWCGEVFVWFCALQIGYFGRFQVYVMFYGVGVEEFDRWYICNNFQSKGMSEG